MKDLINDLQNRGLDLLVSGHTIHPKGNYFRMSSTGMCPKKVILEYLGAESFPREPSSMRTLFHGTEIHEFMDKGVDKAIWGMGGQVMRITPFRLSAFGAMFNPHDADLDPGMVYGTPDHIYLVIGDNNELNVVIVDHKSANEFAFKMAKKEEKSHHFGQVGAYAIALKDVLGRFFGFNSMNIHLFVAYISKKDLEVYVKEVDTVQAMTSAQVYWTEISKLCNDLFNKNDDDSGTLLDIHARLPQSQPRQSWECGYCPFFSQTAQEKKDKQAPMLCCACGTIGDAIEQGLIEEYVLDPR